jgi:hypothetical protein
VGQEGPGFQPTQACRRQRKSKEGNGRSFGILSIWSAVGSGGADQGCEGIDRRLEVAVGFVLLLGGQGALKEYRQARILATSRPQSVEQGAQRAHGIVPSGLGDHRSQASEAPIAEGAQEMLLAGIVEVDGPLRNARVGGNLVYGGGCASAGDGARGGGEEPLGAVVADLLGGLHGGA